MQDGWTDLSRRIRGRIMAPAARAAHARRACWPPSRTPTSRRWRRSAPGWTPIVGDRETAQKLKAWYRQLCKRPCFHDAYLQAFNEPGAHLVDTDGKGVERITEKGVVVAGREYEVDCIIYASGFEVGTEYTRRAGFDLTGRDGLKLSEAWADGMRSKHGIHVHGFPNAFFVQPTQGANLISNVPHNLTEAGRTIAVDRPARAGRRRQAGRGHARRPRTPGSSCCSPASGRMMGAPDCTPGYYNNEGQPRADAPSTTSATPPAPTAYFKYIDDWRIERQVRGPGVPLTKSPSPLRGGVRGGGASSAPAAPA